MLVTGGGHAKQLSDLTYYTEQYPPFNYIEDGELVGIAVDLLLVATALQEKPIQKKDILLVPWARGYKELELGPNVVLFATTRSSAREKLFKWAGPIAKDQVVLFTKKSKGIKLDSIKDALRYRVGSLKYDVAAQTIIEKGYPENKIIYAADGDTLAKQLKFDRIDIWAYDKVVGQWYMKNLGFNAAKYEIALKFEEINNYFAFSLDVEDALVAELQHHIERVKTTKEPGTGVFMYERMLEKYF